MSSNQNQRAMKKLQLQPNIPLQKQNMPNRHFYRPNLNQPTKNQISNQVQTDPPTVNTTNKLQLIKVSTDQPIIISIDTLQVLVDLPATLRI